LFRGGCSSIVLTRELYDMWGRTIRGSVAFSISKKTLRGKKVLRGGGKPVRDEKAGHFERPLTTNSKRFGSIQVPSRKKEGEKYHRRGKRERYASCWRSRFEQEEKLASKTMAHGHTKQVLEGGWTRNACT